MTVPNEFQKKGKFSIGITGGIESTLAQKIGLMVVIEWT